MRSLVRFARERAKCGSMSVLSVKNVFVYNFSVTQKGRALTASGHFPPLTLAQLTNDVVSSCGSIDTCTMTNPLHSREAAIKGIESFFHSMLETVSRGEMPTRSNDRVMRQFTPSCALLHEYCPCFFLRVWLAFIQPNRDYTGDLLLSQRPLFQSRGMQCHYSQCCMPAWSFLCQLGDLYIS